MTVGFESKNKLFLLRRSYPAEDIVLLRCLIKLFVSPDFRHINRAVSAFNTCFFRNIADGLYAVARNHLESNALLLEIIDCLIDIFAHGILDKYKCHRR